MDSETYADESFLVERLATRPGAPRMALGSGSIVLRTNLHQCVILGIIGMIAGFAIASQLWIYKVVCGLMVVLCL